MSNTPTNITTSIVERQEWRNAMGALHREDGGPALISANGAQEWYRHGILHRDNDLPAIVADNGATRYWYHYGTLHRDGDKPGIIWGDGATQIWVQMGRWHRAHDQPAIVQSDGTKMWFWRGKLHRDNYLPAHIQPSLNMQEWWVHGVQTPQAELRVHHRKCVMSIIQQSYLDMALSSNICRLMATIFV